MGGPCPATPPSTDRTGEVLIALGKISRQPLRSADVDALIPRAIIEALIPGVLALPQRVVRGHEKVRTFGHEKSAPVATRSPQLWPSDVLTPR